MIPFRGHDLRPPLGPASHRCKGAAVAIWEMAVARGGTAYFIIVAIALSVALPYGGLNPPSFATSSLGWL